MAPNFSKFYDDALKEGLGLVEFIERHHPGETDLKEIKPEVEMPYKGYFPSGKICKIFGKEFRRWCELIGRPGKQERILTAIARRLSLRKADLIVSGSGGSSVDGTHGGGYSWIHPRLMTHFLQWCCPEFAAEVLDVFGRYVSGSLDIEEQTSILKAIHAKELAAVERDAMLYKEISERQAVDLKERASQLQIALDQTRSMQEEAENRLRCATEELEKMRVQENEQYQKLLDAKAEREEAQAAVDIDRTRPRNVLRDIEDPLQAERHSVPTFHLYAALIPRAMGIALSQKAFAMYVEQVFKRVPIFGDRDKEFKKLCSELGDAKSVCKGKKRVRQWYKHVLTRGQKFEVCDVIRDMLRVAMCKVFGADRSLEFEDYLKDLQPRHLWNPVSVQTFMSTLIKFGEEVDYCTEVKVEKLVDVAQRFNDLCDECGMPMHFVLPDDV